MKHDALGSIVSIANQKGGVGKTTTTVNLAASLAALGERVLIVDMDPQGNSTTGLGVDKYKTQGIYAVLCGEATLADCICPTSVDDLFVLPTNMDLAGAEVELVAEEAREYRLKQAFSHYHGERFDRVFIDCPPSLSLLTVNAFAASDRVMVTLQTEFFAMEGLTQLLETIRYIRKGINPDMQMDGIVLTLVDRRNNLAVQVEEEVRQYFGQQVYQQIIPRNVRLSEAPSYGLPALHHDIRSSGAQAYLALAQEFRKRELSDSGGGDV